jgi:hypothetical protein
MTRDARRIRIGSVAAVALLCALGAYLVFPLLRCVDSCFVDYFAIHDGQTAHFEMPDTRLNSWILGWVHHAAFADPASLFDANAFYPARNTLAGSEHLLGVALQTLPFRLFSDSAVMLHQTALILSFLLLALSTFALVRWMTGSTWAAFMAGAVAPFMPWRYSELGHLQLLSVQWLPLVWLLSARVLTGPRPGRDALWLGLVLAVQMLSSFYLAYLTLFSTGLLAVAIYIAYRPPAPAISRFAAAVALPSALVALTAIPYVARFSAYRFTEASATEFISPATVAFSVLAPPLALKADLAGIGPVTYHAPLVVLLFAALALGWWWAPREDGDDRRRVGALSVAMAAAIAGAFVLMLGREVQIAGAAVKLPGYWLAQFVPGFSQMRAEFRWGIIIGVAAPVLAGSGIAWLERRLGRMAGDTARRRSLAAARLATATLFALNIQWYQLPARDAWGDAGDVMNAHRALAMLEAGPVLEIPWRIHRISTATNGSRYMLASSFHWWPILNGYTAYVPASYHFLQRLAQSLPDQAAIENLRRLTGVRWIVVHPDRLGRQQRALWSHAERSRALRVAVAKPDFRIYEVPGTPMNDAWRAALLAEEPGALTMTGLRRDPIAPPEPPGSFQVDVRGSMRYEQGSGMPYFATVRLANSSDAAWPGLDIQTEGLVLLRYRFLDERGEIVREATTSLDEDLPPGRTTMAQALLFPPARDGRFRVRFDIVQRVGDEFRDLGFAAIEREIEVSKRPPLPRATKPRE